MFCSNKIAGHKLYVVICFSSASVFTILYINIKLLKYADTLSFTKICNFQTYIVHLKLEAKTPKIVQE